MAEYSSDEMIEIADEVQAEIAGRVADTRGYLPDIYFCAIGIQLLFELIDIPGK
jgi:hypothetical protein